LIALCVTMFIAGIEMGPIGAFLPELTTYGGLAFGVIMAGLCLITLLYTLAVPETRNRDLEQV